MVEEQETLARPTRRTSLTGFVPILSLTSRPRGNSDATIATPAALTLTRPQAAHIGGPNDSTVQRPIHFMRVPSFNPPAFSEIEPPPPLKTPPPLYETTVSPSSGLADYFSRLSEAYDSDSDPERNDRARVEIPLTPGGRTNRSMDERRI
ncbi:hypothetical protein AA0113_g12243 [Alternaria arborescens]|uniref:Uncharacterized protein n=1 Tax=Alternaria arborescens TaxID=156630 RepID=A0A4Q4PXV5_9PLEO|nr:hypothetical protein AA0111_g11933 [Alternaria arborescens]RYO14568.1 hypothetical protein AA0111_g11933 [Alternaria arborescens]RYO27742.1 hypothetical protein AA0113_g12243 [Alternaria arborescens]